MLSRPVAPLQPGRVERVDLRALPAGAAALSHPTISQQDSRSGYRCQGDQSDTEATNMRLPS
jgi:hypothetical protein